MQRQNRLKLLRLLLESKRICTREEIIEEMNANGANMGLPQLTEDMRLLGAYKTPNLDGSPYWTLPHHGTISAETYIHSANLTEMVLDVRTAGNLVIVRTFDAAGGAVAAAIDEGEDPEILGTIAGYNTVFVAVRDTEVAGRIADKIRSIACP